MRAPIKATVLLAVMVLASFSVASGQAVYVDVDEVQGLTPEGKIPTEGTDLVIPVRFVNGDYAQLGISNGYRFYGSFENIQSAWNPAYPWDMSFAMPLGQYPWFDYGIATIYIKPDLYPTLVSTEAVAVGMGAVASGGIYGKGLPANFNGIAYFITLTGVTGELTMDTTWWQPSNFWLWTQVPDPGPSWGGPYVFPVDGGGCEEVYTECWPQPSVLKALTNDRILEFYIYCQDPGVVDMASVRVNGIPNYLNDGVAVWDAVNQRIWTNAFIMRFLGASGFRPIPEEGIQSTYTVTYTTTTGEVSVVGDFVLTVTAADVTFDGQVNVDDVVLLIDYLFRNGKPATLFGEELSELMDVDGSGRFDLLDVIAAIQIAGI